MCVSVCLLLLRVETPRYVYGLMCELYTAVDEVVPIVSFNEFPSAVHYNVNLKSKSSDKRTNVRSARGKRQVDEGAWCVNYARRNKSRVRLAGRTRACLTLFLCAVGTTLPCTSSFTLADFEGLDEWSAKSVATHWIVRGEPNRYLARLHANSSVH